MQIIFVCIYHKRSRLFEEGVKLLTKDYPLLLQQTGFDKGFGGFGVPNVEIVTQGDHINYDVGLQRFKDILQNRKWDIVHFIDNDLFITDMNYIKQTLKDFEDSDLGYASYLENGNNYDLSKYKFKGTIAEVTDQHFVSSIQPGGIKGVPQWENAMMMFKRDTWDKLDQMDFINTPAYIKKMTEMGIKLGVKKVEERLRYSHAGPGFIHIGNLMAYYYMLENFDLGRLTNSELDLSRMGYFFYQRRKFGGYAWNIEQSLQAVASSLGEQKCIDAWLRLVKEYYE